MRLSLACCPLLLVLLAPAGANLLLREGDLLQDVGLQTGQELQLALAENPTTGYQWTITWAPAEALRQTRDEYVAAPAGARVGSGGTHFFTLVAMAPGEVWVAIRYARPWAGGESELPRSLHVHIVGQAGGTGGSHKQPVKLTQADFVPNHVVDVNELVTVVLPENPTTGFGWRSWWNPATALRKLVDRYHPRPGRVLPGAGGSHRWVFRTMHEGQVVVHFQYGRPWPGGEQGVPRMLVLLVPAG